MKTRIALAFLLLVPRLSCADGAFFDRLPLYLYVFVCPSQLIISSEVCLGHEIDAAAVPHALTGRVSRLDGKLHADLSAYVDSRNARFKGEMEIDRPVYATSGSTHSGIVIISTFVVSHRPDPSELLETHCSKRSD